MVDFAWSPTAFADFKFRSSSMLKLTEFPLAVPWFKKLPTFRRMMQTYFSSELSSTPITALRSYCKFLLRFKKRFEKLNLTSRQLR